VSEYAELTPVPEPWILTEFKVAISLEAKVLIANG
jgi:hypothetical protein